MTIRPEDANFAVSIITPFLNAERYLPEAIASVLAQTWTNWELLLIDDGSTDGSLETALAAARADSRIRLVKRAPGPASAAAARNAGLRAARGQFIAFLDADDLFEPDKLRHDLAVFAAHPNAMMVYGPTRWFWPGGSDWVELMRRQAGAHPPPDLLHRVLLLQKGHVPCTCGVLIRREAIHEVGGFIETMSLYEDQTLWAKIFLRYPVFVTNVAMARYRQHSGSATAKAIADGVYDRFKPHEARAAFLEWVADHVLASNRMTPAIERGLRLAFAPYAAHRRPLSARDRLDLSAAAAIAAMRAAAHRGKLFATRATRIGIARTRADVI